MPKKVQIKSAVAGVTANNRRALAAVTPAQLPFDAPTQKGDGVLLGRNEFMHLLFQRTSSDATCVYYVQVWWYSEISARWHKGEIVSVNNDDIVTLEVQGLDRIYLQPTSAVTTDPASTLSAWIGLVVPV
jgi:hypothetical protein